MRIVSLLPSATEIVADLGIDPAAVHLEITEDGLRLNVDVGNEG